MQYQSSLDRKGLVELALEKYFASVDAKNLDAVMDCFHDNAMLTVQNVFVVHDTKDAIRRMFVDFMGSYETIIHRDFVCTIDEKNGRIAASFVAELIGADGNTTLLHNTNFWRIRGDKFQEVYVYMSGDNPLV
ncbi:MAG: ketosteroid isomerase-like protein [Patiriisocius sp.]|jgi:ketosteroid isomerase-like protein